MTKRSAAPLWAFQPIHEGYFTWQGSCFNGKSCHILFTSCFWSHHSEFGWSSPLLCTLSLPSFFTLICRESLPPGQAVSCLVGFPPTPECGLPPQPGRGCQLPRSCRASCFAIAGDAVMGPSFPALPLFNRRILCGAAPLTSGFHFFSAADAICSVANQCLETSLQAALPVNKDPINSGSTQSLSLPKIPVTSYCPQEEKIIKKMKPEKT